MTSTNPPKRFEKACEICTNPFITNRGDRRWCRECVPSGTSCKAAFSYGINKATYDALLARSKGVCELCGQEEQRQNRKLCIDHNHETGAIRGILCNGCNILVGHVEARQSLREKLPLIDAWICKVFEPILPPKREVQNMIVYCEGITEETREKMRKSHLGIKPSEETRRKRSISLKATLARKRLLTKTDIN